MNSIIKNQRCPPLNFGKEVAAVCEGDTLAPFVNTAMEYTICHPSPTSSSSLPSTNSFKFEDFEAPRKITIVANYYTGCNAGRRESGVFAHVAQTYYERYPNDVTFIQSIKGGGSCTQWSDIYQSDAQELYPDSNIIPKDMPWSVNDENYAIRDDLFTTPFSHPSYVILDENLQVRHKFVGPCCGYEQYRDCTADVALGLDEMLSGYIDDLISEQGMSPTEAPVPDVTMEPTASPTAQECQAGEWSEWSECSVKCGKPTKSSVQFRWRKVTPIEKGPECPSPMEVRNCIPAQEQCIDEFGNVDDALSCVFELGETWTVETVAEGFDSPRDVAFHPTPGLHLGNFSEGRIFHPTQGEEAWVTNAGNHSVSIVASLGSEDHQTTISRRDRGYYHYMINATAISFNHVSDSGRTADRDGFNYFAICNDDPNTYLGTKEPNFFMGPTLYNSYPSDRNTVNRLGDECRDEEPCHFLHSDMLHEAPVCIGIAHDPEVQTTHGNVYWAFDATGNRKKGQLVKFDFQQPHGPGSMDHSVAAIRRFVEVELETGPEGGNVHAGIVVHPTRREVYVAVPGGNKIVVVNADSGSFARTAREEYPIYSNRLPSFEYSIWECTEQRVFADGINVPTGMALSNNGDRLFVAERSSGNILVFEVESGALLQTVNTGFKTIGGMAFGPTSNALFFVDEETGSLNKIKLEMPCFAPFASRSNPRFSEALEKASTEYGEELSLMKDYRCKVDQVIPDASFFDQVHSETGYADDNPDVQSAMAGMDASAALLANRTDCGYDSELNFDALLLGGYYCHTCLPEKELTCDAGGICENVQWLGYMCDNEYLISIDNDLTVGIMDANNTQIDSEDVELKRGVTYRFSILENEKGLGLCASVPLESASRRRLYGIGGTDDSPAPSQTMCANKGPLLISVNDMFPSEISFFVEGGESDEDYKLILSIADDVSKKKSLSGGAISIIVIGSVMLLIAVSLFIKKKMSAKSESPVDSYDETAPESNP